MATATFETVVWDPLYVLPVMSKGTSTACTKLIVSFHRPMPSAVDDRSIRNTTSTGRSQDIDVGAAEGATVGVSPWTQQVAWQFCCTSMLLPHKCVYIVQNGSASCPQEGDDVGSEVVGIDVGVAVIPQQVIEHVCRI